MREQADDTPKDRIMLAMLDAQLRGADAPAIIALATTTIALMAAVDSSDPSLATKLLGAAANTFQRMAETTQRSLTKAAVQQIDCAQTDKHFFLMGGFERKDDLISPPA